MEDRYQNIKQYKKDDIRYYGTTLYPKIKYHVDDVYILSRKYDRLDILAHKYYKDSTLWWIIAEANKIKGGLILPENKQLRIPMDIHTILKDYREINK